MAKKKIAKKQAKKASKKVVKKVVKKGKVKSQDVKIQVQVSSLPAVVTEKDIIEPIHKGKQYAIAKTWVSSNQIMRMVQKTPPQHIYERPGKGGQKFTYVTGNYVEKVLNYVFGFLWDFEVINHGQAGDFIWVQGKLTVKNAQGATISKTQFGRSEVKYKKDTAHKPENYVDYGNDLKAATTDALKKCASLLGIAGDVYGKQEYKHEAEKVVREEPVKVVSVKDTVPGPDGDPVFTCSNCGGIVDEQVANYSKKMFGQILCRECQAGAKRK